MPIAMTAVPTKKTADTSYDELLMSGVPRDLARERVGPRVDQVLEGWRRA